MFQKVPAASREDSTREPLSSSSKQAAAGQSVSPVSQNETSNSLSAAPNQAPKSIIPRPARPRRVQIVQNFLLIWLDSPSAGKNEECETSLERVRQIVTTVNTYTDADECVNFINDNHDENIFLIISGSLASNFISRVHHMSQIDSIYILCEDKCEHQQWTSEWTKVKGVFTNIRSLCEVLQQHTRRCDRDSTSVTITNARHTDELEPTFMYISLFRECILDISYDADEMKQMVDGCRELHADHDKKLKIFDEFKSDYYDHTPIWWYTRGCFIYEMLNRALRTFDTSTIVLMGFFIQDLHRRIEQLHSEQQHLFTEQFIVYRGQGLLKTDLDKLRDSYGGLLSFNNFLSTSRDRDTSLGFAHAALEKPDHVAVLFRITVAPSVPTSPFTIIGDEGYYKAQEQEILFSTNSIFRIGLVKKLDSSCPLFQTELTLTTNNDDLFTNLTQTIKKEISGTSGWHRLGKLLLRSGDLKKAEALYLRLLQDASESDLTQVSFLNHQLGQVYSAMGEYSKAFKYHEKYLEIKKQSLPPKHSDLATSYNNIGLVYFSMGEYSKALQYYEKSLEIGKTSLPRIHSGLATNYNNMGLLYSAVGKYSKAIEYHKSGLEIMKQSLPSKHPDLATSYNNIGRVYSDMGEYTKALEYYEKSLEIKKQSLPHIHTDLATNYNNIGAVYFNMGEYSKAIEYYEKSQKIMKQSLPPKHPDLATSHNNIGRVYSNMGEYSKALEYYEKDLEIMKQSLPSTHPDLAASYNNIGAVYSNMGEYPKALEYYEKSLEIIKQSLPSKHPDMATSYNNIGRVYSDMGEYTKALEYHEKSLEIMKQSLPPIHPDLATSYNNFDDVYSNMGDYSKALEYYEKSLEIKKQSLPPMHPDLATCYNNIGAVYSEVGEYSKAIEYCEKSLKIIKQSLPHTHPALAVSCSCLGRLYRSMEDYPKALQYFQMTLKIHTKTLPKTHPYLAITYGNIGDVHGWETQTRHCRS